MWVVDTPAPQGVGCVRFASGGGWWLVWSCGPTLRVLVAGLCQWLVAGVCGVASLNPRGGLRLVPHCGGCLVVVGRWWGSATAHANDKVFFAGNKVWWWLRESAGGL